MINIKKIFRKEYIPNYLTILRILMVPIIITILLVDFGGSIYSFSFQENLISIHTNVLVAGILFIIACLTDAIDGYLARKYQWVSNFGKFWDPLADKILTHSVLFCFASPQLNFVPIWIPIIILVRDLIIDGVRMISVQKGVVVPANIWGKLKTVVQMVGMILIFFIGTPYGMNSVFYWGIQNILMYLSLGLSLISGFIYGYQFMKQPRKLKV